MHKKLKHTYRNVKYIYLFYEEVNKHNNNNNDLSELIKRVIINILQFAHSKIKS